MGREYYVDDSGTERTVFFGRPFTGKNPNDPAKTTQVPHNIWHRGDRDAKLSRYGVQWRDVPDPDPPKERVAAALESQAIASVASVLPIEGQLNLIVKRIEGTLSKDEQDYYTDFLAYSATVESELDTQKAAIKAGTIKNPGQISFTPAPANIKGRRPREPKQ